MGGVAHGQLRAGRHGAGDGRARGVEDEAARCGLDAVAAAELGPELEPLGDRDVLGADVAVALTDMHGRNLATIQPATLLPVGRHRITIPTDQLSEGVYFVRLTVDETVKVLKLVVAR